MSLVWPRAHRAGLRGHFQFFCEGRRVKTKRDRYAMCLLYSVPIGAEGNVVGGRYEFPEFRVICRHLGNFFVLRIVWIRPWFAFKHLFKSNIEYNLIRAGGGAVEGG